MAGAKAIPEAGAGDDVLHESEGATVAIGEDGFGAVLVDDVAPAVADFADGFCPCDGLPLVVAFFAGRSGIAFKTTWLYRM